MNKNIFINVKEIEYIYREDSKETKTKFSKHDFEKFLEFLNIDFHDWVKSNLRYFNRDDA